MSTKRNRYETRYWPDVEILQDSAATVVRVSYAIPGGVDLSATGSARRERGDANDPVTGELLAAARAYATLAARLEKMGSSRVRNADAIRRHREQIRARRLRGLTEPAAHHDPVVMAAEKAKAGDRPRHRVKQLPRQGQKG